MLLLSTYRLTALEAPIAVGACRRCEKSGTQQLRSAPARFRRNSTAKFDYGAAGIRSLAKFRSKVSGFPALRFDAVSPYGDSRYYGAANPGKEK